MKPVPYAPPRQQATVDIRSDCGPRLRAVDLERVALMSIAHEVARRAVHSRTREDAPDPERADSLELAANILRDVCGLPEFDFSAQESEPC